MSRGSDAISPTAHYTGQVWFRNGLSHPELATRRGQIMFEAARPTLAVSRLLGASGLEDYLVARHATIDALLTEAIEQDGVTQVVEVACGLSPRGWRFKQRYGARITYVEADLPAMAALKRDALARIGTLGDGHRVEDLDALREEGPGSLAAIARTLDGDSPAAILTEGLLGYLELDGVLRMWRGFAATLGRFPGGRYLSDAYVAEDLRHPVIQAFRVLLGAFVRGRVHEHFENDAELERLLRESGFADAGVVRASDHPAAEGLGRGAEVAHIIDARTR